MSYAWCEQILDVNLSTGEIAAMSLPRQVYVETIGGVGLAAQLVWENVPADADPLGPDNRLAIVAGPLSGTTWPGTGRLVMAARSPLTGVWGEASMGGYFATHLKRAGFDAILIRGASPAPVMLVIAESGVWLESAERLWGEETYTAEDHLKQQFGDVETITIGPAGERLVPMASLVHHMGNDIAARCGLGAVAGSKRLKALVVHESSKQVPVANAEAFKTLTREAFRLFRQNDFLNTIRHGGGTASATPISIDMNDMPVRNWELEALEWKDEASRLTGQAMQEHWPSEKDTCYACPIACKWRVDAPSLPDDASIAGHLAGPEYESLAGLGAQTQTHDPLVVIQASDLCNRLGIDTISAGSTIAWALEAHEKGMLTDEHVDHDLKMEWGNPDLAVELVRRMAENRPGIGALLAQSSRQAALQIGDGLEFAIQVKGLELPFHHPRALRGLEIAYATLPRGATHNEEGVTWDRDGCTYQDWIAEMIGHMDLSGANSAMVYCQFLAGALNADYTARLLTAATGETYASEDLYRAGERTWYLRRAFNLRLGIGLEADELPKRVVKQIKESYATLSDFDRALEEFHRQRELDKRGVPSARKLAAVGLDYLIEEFDAR